MKSITLLSFLLPTISAHAIFQRVSVNGADQGLLNGVRSPNSNSPVQNVQSQDITCNVGLKTPVSTSVIKIPAGAKVGAQYQHVIGGPQFPGDADNPIAASHKGPVVVYLAKVSNSGTAATSGLSWFKIAEEGFNTATLKWAVDAVLASNGWWYFTFPSCIAPGQYLMRVEIIALHSASQTGQAQFYPGCANIEVTGSGTFTPSNTVSFPGAYSATDPGIKLSIYGNTGKPENGGKAYKIPGPAPIVCPAGGGSQPTAAVSKTTLATSTVVKTSVAGGVGAPLWGQCGGGGWNGPVTCAQGKCVTQGDWYSQCVA